MERNKSINGGNGMNRQAIKTKVKLGWELTEQERAYWLLFIATAEQVEEYLRSKHHTA